MYSSQKASSQASLEAVRVRDVRPPSLSPNWRACVAGLVLLAASRSAGFVRHHSHACHLCSPGTTRRWLNYAYHGSPIPFGRLAFPVQSTLHIARARARALRARRENRIQQALTVHRCCSPCLGRSPPREHTAANVRPPRRIS